MPEFWRAVFVPLLATLALLPLMEFALMRPQPIWRRPLWAWGVQVGTVLLGYAIGLAVFQRPVFACCQVLGWWLLILVVSRVKSHVLREPFVFQDLEYFVDMLRHPRLYVPFLGYANAMFGFVAAIAMVATALWFEDGMVVLPFSAGPGSLADFLIGLAVLAVAGGLLIRMSLRRAAGVSPSFDAEADVRAMSLIPCMWLYARAEREVPVLPRPLAGMMQAVGDGAELPHVVVVQSESFFDARRVCGGVHPQVYGWLDEIKRQSVLCGLLEAPAWGANTVRSEFAFLSGVAAADMGVHRFNPYRRLGSVHTLAHELKQAGYRTVCVHPYAASFYGRDRVMPRLGFDEFVDVSAFSEADRCGPYVGDRAVADKVSALMAAATQPVFVFVITMENHGPLHLETLDAEDVARLHTQPPPPGHEDLTVYLRHVENAGAMLRTLCACLSAQPREGWLCWYGDHIPIMPKVYAAAGFEDPRSDYFLWSSDAARQGGGELRSLVMSDLAGALLAAINLRRGGQP